MNTYVASDSNALSIQSPQPLQMPKHNLIDVVTHNGLCSETESRKILKSWEKKKYIPQSNNQWYNDQITVTLQSIQLHYNHNPPC